MSTLKAEDIDPDVRVANYMALPCNRIHAWGPRRITDFELILALRGEFEFVNRETGEQVRQLPGTVLLIHPDELHTYRLLSGGDSRTEAFFSCIHLELHPDRNRAGGPHAITPTPERLTSVQRDAEIMELFRRIDQVNREPGRFRDALLKTMAKELWLRLSEKWSAPEDDDASARVDAMLQYLRDHRLNHPGRNELAARFHLSPQHVNLIFRRETGMTPIRFVHRELMREAYRLLVVEQLSVKETADRLRFSTQFYFSRIFKREMGFSPGTAAANASVNRKKEDCG
mgnify:CR=1 FL=1